MVVEIPHDLGRIVGVHPARRHLPPLGGPGAADDGPLESGGRIVVQDAADGLSGHFERVNVVAREMAQRPRSQNKRLAADLDSHLAFKDPERPILARVNMGGRKSVLRHPLLDH